MSSDNAKVIANVSLRIIYDSAHAAEEDDIKDSLGGAMEFLENQGFLAPLGSVVDDWKYQVEVNYE